MPWRLGKKQVAEPTIEQMKTYLATLMPPSEFADHSRKFYANDSYIPPGCGIYEAGHAIVDGKLLPVTYLVAASEPRGLSKRLREEGIIPVGGESTMLTLSSLQIQTALPPYLKLSELYLDRHPVYLVSPSSGFLDITSHKGTKFLYRGERTESSAKTAQLILDRVITGTMKSHKDSAVHVTPESATAVNAYAKENGCLWIVKTGAMDTYPVDIQNFGWEILFPQIGMEYVAGCVTTPQVLQAIGHNAKIPEGLLHSFDRVNLEELVEKLSY